MNENKILEICLQALKDKRYLDVISEISNYTDNKDNLSFNLALVLAKAYFFIDNTEELNKEYLCKTTLNLLEDFQHKDEALHSFDYNYLMGINFYILGKKILATSYLKKALDLYEENIYGVSRDDIDIILDESLHYMLNPHFDLPYSQKLDKFFDDFTHDKDSIYKNICYFFENKLYLDAMNLIQERLSYLYAHVDFNIHLREDKICQIALSYKSNPDDFFKYLQFVNQVPKTLSDKFAFCLGIPRSDAIHIDDIFSLDLKDIELSLTDVSIDYRKLFDITVYIEKLHDEKNVSYHDIYKFLVTAISEAIGENRLFSHINNINISKSKLEGDVFTLDHLYEKLEEIGLDFNQDEIYCCFNRFYTEYRNKEDVVQNKLRLDILKGNTIFSHLLSAYFSEHNYLLQELYSDNLSAVFIAFERDNKATDEDSLNEQMQELVKIEEKIFTSLPKKGVILPVGKAVGKHYAYIDLLVYDFDTFSHNIFNILSECNLHHALYKAFDQKSSSEFLVKIEDE